MVGIFMFSAENLLHVEGRLPFDASCGSGQPSTPASEYTGCVEHHDEIVTKREVALRDVLEVKRKRAPARHGPDDVTMSMLESKDGG